MTPDHAVPQPPQYLGDAYDATLFEVRASPAGTFTVGQSGLVIAEWPAHAKSDRTCIITA